MFDNLLITLRNNADHYMTVEGEAGLVHLLTEAADAIENTSKAYQMMAEVTKQYWIPVTEQLPKYGTPVLAYGSRGGIFVAKYERARAEWDIDYWWKLNSSIHVCNPTHWMPLPMPPEEKT